MKRTKMLGRRMALAACLWTAALGACVSPVIVPGVDAGAEPTTTSTAGPVCTASTTDATNPVRTITTVATGTATFVVTSTSAVTSTGIVTGVISGTVTASGTVTYAQTETSSTTVTTTSTFTATLTVATTVPMGTGTTTATRTTVTTGTQTTSGTGTTTTTRTTVGTGTTTTTFTQTAPGTGTATQTTVGTRTTTTTLTQTTTGTATTTTTRTVVGTSTGTTSTTQTGVGTTPTTTTQTGTGSATSTPTTTTTSSTTSTDLGVNDAGEPTFTGGTYPEGAGSIPLDTTANTWRTGLDPGGKRYVFISPEGNPTVLQGISMTGLETGTRETKSGAGFWLYLSNQGNETTSAPKVLTNVVDVLVQNWNTDVIRIPICGSAWTQDYAVQDWGGAKIAGYKEWVDLAIQRIRSQGKVAIIDLHLWAVAKMSKGTDVQRGTFVSNGQTRNYGDYEDGCTGINKVNGIDSCAPKDWYTEDPNVWQCAIANADGVTLHNAHKNREAIAAMWKDVAGRYKDDSGVWFELFNEPYSRKAVSAFPAFGANELEKDYAWDLWTEIMSQWIAAIRDGAGAKNIIIVNGLDWAYSFGPQYGPLADPDKYLPWKSKVANIAYGFHPYQHGACCGQIGSGDSDLSATDPYQSGYCEYYPDGSVYGKPSGAALPGSSSCVQTGYAASQDKKLPPCHWVETAYNPATRQNGLCAGDRSVCAALDRAACDAMDWNSPKAGGWSTYVLPMNRFGPLIASEFGSFDCSSPFVKTLLKYMSQNKISYTAWALWPQDSGGPGGLGACGYPSVMTPVPGQTGDFRQCADTSGCTSLVQPLRWAGKLIHADLLSQ